MLTKSESNADTGNEARERATRVKTRALEIGFHKVGIARAAELTQDRAHLENWLALERHGAMQWLEREPEKRADPRLVFPAACSVVAVALNYYTPHEHENNPQAGKVSRYAWGDDYHEVVGEKLKELLAWIKTEWAEADGKACVDIQPVMDKAWAARAGLGWVGKHSNLITREYGSWVFLGELILNLDLEPDAPFPDEQCGSCTACLDACPTDAIVAPYQIDANKCISYATIELRDAELPPYVAENLNGWLYGCDICQDVCPWNRFEQTTDEPRFEPRAGLVNADLAEILSHTPEEYAPRFRKSAMKRAKITGLQRNARALLENKTRVGE